MKNITPFLIIGSLFAFTAFTACGPRKNTQASNVRIEQLKKDSVATHRQLDKKNAESLKKETVSTEKTTVAVNTVKTTKTVTEVKKISPLPPAKVASVFKARFPAAKEVVWTKRSPTVTATNKDIKDYKVYFQLETNNNSAVYSEKGVLIETREQILPDKLPQNISTAIKNKYPEHQIISASAVKNSKISGSFIAVIKIPEQVEEKEVMLLENGTFVE